MSETTTSIPLKTAACSATWDLIEQLVQLESSKNRLHLEYMGKAMPADVYLRFQKLRDERIPALQSQLRADLPAAPDQPPAHLTHAYADQFMLHGLIPAEPAPQAPSADALDAARYRWLRDISVPPHNFYLSVPDEFGGVKYAPVEVDAAIDAAIAAMAAAQEGGNASAGKDGAA